MGDPNEKPDKAHRSEPNLELPTFGFGKKKDKKPKTAPKPAPRETSVPDARPSAPVAVTPQAPPRPPAPPVAQAAPPAPSRPPAPPAAPVAPRTAVTPPEPTKSLKVRPEKPAREKIQRDKPVKPPRPSRTGPRLVLPQIPGYAAAAITGAATGAFTVLLAWATAEGCAAVRGVGTCGGFGLFALVAILGIDVVLAAATLRAFRVTDPTTTSLLGVGLLSVLTMIFFLGDTQSSAMVYVIPLLMGLTFLAAWWLTDAIANRVEETR